MSILAGACLSPVTCYQCCRSRVATCRTRTVRKSTSGASGERARQRQQVLHPRAGSAPLTCSGERLRAAAIEPLVRRAGCRSRRQPPPASSALWFRPVPARGPEVEVSARAANWLRSLARSRRPRSVSPARTGNSALNKGKHIARLSVCGGVGGGPRDGYSRPEPNPIVRAAPFLSLAKACAEYAWLEEPLPVCRRVPNQTASTVRRFRCSRPQSASPFGEFAFSEELPLFKSFRRAALPARFGHNRSSKRVRFGYNSLGDRWRAVRIAARRAASY